jgi:hypothetical protein
MDLCGRNALNYLYDFETVESDHEDFFHVGNVARSEQVDALLHSKEKFDE